MRAPPQALIHYRSCRSVRLPKTLLGPLPGGGLGNTADRRRIARLRSGGGVTSAARPFILPLRECLQNRAPSPRRVGHELARRCAMQTSAVVRGHSNLQKIGFRHRAGSLLAVVTQRDARSYDRPSKGAVSQCDTSRASIGRCRNRKKSGATPFVSSLRFSRCRTAGSPDREGYPSRPLPSFSASRNRRIPLAR